MAPHAHADCMEASLLLPGFPCYVDVAVQAERSQLCAPFMAWQRKSRALPPVSRLAAVMPAGLALLCWLAAGYCRSLGLIACCNRCCTAVLIYSLMDVVHGFRLAVHKADITALCIVAEPSLAGSEHYQCCRCQFACCVCPRRPCEGSIDRMTRDSGDSCK